MIFAKRCWYLKAPKQTRPYPIGPRYFDISALTKMTHKHIYTKANTDKLCETMQNQHYSPIKKKQHNLGVRFEPVPLLEFYPSLESCSDIYAGPTSCLIITLLFNVLFLRYFPFRYFQFSLSLIDLLISVLYTQIELCIITKHAPDCWLAASVFLGHGPTLRSKAFFKNCVVHL